MWGVLEWWWWSNPRRDIPLVCENDDQSRILFVSLSEKSHLLFIKELQFLPSIWFSFWISRKLVKLTSAILRFSTRLSTFRPAINSCSQVWSGNQIQPGSMDLLMAVRLVTSFLEEDCSTELCCVLTKLHGIFLLTGLDTWHFLESPCIRRRRKLCILCFSSLLYLSVKNPSGQMTPSLSLVFLSCSFFFFSDIFLLQHLPTCFVWMPPDS